jgi:DNA repair exonuclease SbcCD ATPase subunit
MSIEKSELKSAFAHSFGCDADDDLEAAQRDVLRAVGRGQAAQTMANEITKIIAKLDMDMESDTPPFRSLEDQKKAKSYLGACLAQAATLAKQSDNLRLQMEGKVMAFEHTIRRLTKIREAEERKAEALKTAEEAPQVGSRVPGVHPGPSIAATRKAEAAATKKQPSKRKCGNCGEPGHTARTCKKKKQKKTRKTKKS